MEKLNNKESAELLDEYLVIINILSRSYRFKTNKFIIPLLKNILDFIIIN